LRPGIPATNPNALTTSKGNWTGAPRSPERTWAEKDGRGPTIAFAEKYPKTDLERFFVLLKQMTVNGYYTSATGIHKDMEYVGNTYLAAFPECAHPEHPSP